MNSTPQIRRVSIHSLHEPVEQQYADALKRYLIERGYATRTVNAYQDCAAHFSWWAEQADVDLARIDETSITKFLDGHLSHCNCGWPTRSDRRDAGAALGHLVLVLWP